jgi:hypothetical protein
MGADENGVDTYLEPLYVRLRRHKDPLPQSSL